MKRFALCVFAVLVLACAPTSDATLLAEAGKALKLGPGQEAFLQVFHNEHQRKVRADLYPVPDVHCVVWVEDGTVRSEGGCTSTLSGLIP
jgi:hypothetical protein